MLGRIRSSLTYANVMATTAVFIALGGGAYAAATLAANSVGSKQLKSSAVTNKNIAKNAVTSTKVKDGSLLKVDFAAGQLPPGPAGPAGPQGTKGDTGAKGDAGAKGDTGAQGDRGPSNAISKQNNSVVNVNVADKVIITFTLTPGSWVVTGHATLNNNDAAQQDGSCDINVAGVIAQSSTVPLAANFALDREVFTLTGGVTVAADTPAELRCTLATNSGNTVAAGMTAIQVGSLATP
jgi:hypothetical protein